MKLNVIVIFNSITDIFFLKYLANIFCIPYYFQEKNCFKMQLPVLCRCIVYQVQELISCKYSICGLWGTSKETSCIESFSAEAAILKCIPSNFFLKIFRCFRTTSKKLVQKYYVLTYHTANKDHAEILQTVFPSFSCVFCVWYKSKWHHIISREGCSIQSYILTRMLASLYFWKSWECGFFLQKAGRF